MGLWGQTLSGQWRPSCRTYEITQQLYRQFNITPEKLIQTFGGESRQLGRELPSTFYGGLGSALVPTNGLVGTVRVLHIMVNVINSDPQTQQLVPRLQFDPAATPGYFNDLLFNEANPNSMASFFREASYGRLRLLGETFGPVSVNLPLTVQTRGDPPQVVIAYISNFGSLSVIRSMLQQALNALDPTVDFSRFDSDGDGRIDAVLLTFAADVRAKPPNGDLFLDPTAGAFTVPWGIFRRLNPSLPPFATTADGVVVDAPVFVHEVEGIKKSPQDFASNFGTYAHELGHVFGLPDLYNPQSLSQVDPGLWSTMATGERFEAQGRPINPLRPGGFAVHFDPWCKLVWGWLTPIEVVRTVGTVTIPAYSEQPVAYRLWAFGSINQPEYFLVVNRQLRGFDRFLPTSGLNIFHIDRSILRNPVLFFNNAVQANPSRKGVDLVDADGRTDMDDAVPNVGNFDWTTFGFIGWQRGNWGDDGDPFPGSTNNRQFAFLTTPSSASYAGQDSGIRVVDINPQVDSVQVTLRLEIKPQIVPVSPQEGEQVFTSRPALQVQFITPFGAPADIDPATIQVRVDGNLITLPPGALDETRQVLTVPLTDPTNPALPLAIGQHTVSVQASNRAGVSADPVSVSFLVGPLTLQVRRDGQGQPLPTTFMVSLPYDFSQAPAGRDSPSFVFGPSLSAIARHGVLNAAGQVGYLFTGEFVEVLRPGRAYWVRLQNDTVLAIDAPDVDRTKSFRIANEPIWDLNEFDVGWQQIGNPFPSPVPASSVQVQLPDGRVLPLADAIAQGVLLGTVYRFTGDLTNPYQAIDATQWTLLPFQGYWIFKRRPCSLLVAPPAPTRRQWVGMGFSGRPRPALAALEIWGEKAEMPYRLAVTRSGSPVPAPPAAPGMTAWGGFQGEGRSDLPLMEVPDQPRRWTLLLRSQQPHQTITVKWRTFGGQRQNRLRLIDPQTLRTLPLNGSGEWTTQTDENGRRLLLLQVTADETAPLRFVDVQVTKMRGRGFLIQGRLSAPAFVRAEVRTLTGRLVTVLPTPDQPNHRLTLRWDGQGTQGLTPSSGIFLLHLRARDLDGRETQRVVVLR
jgi:M6 family metalloprotease-like protein